MENHIQSLKQQRFASHEDENVASNTSKNRSLPSVPNRGQVKQTDGSFQNKEIIEVIDFIDQTKRTLTEYGEKLKKHLNFNLIQQEM